MKKKRRHEMRVIAIISNDGKFAVPTKGRFNKQVIKALNNSPYNANNKEDGKQ